MVKKCVKAIRIQWGLWRRSSGRNEEALGAPEVPFVLGEGTGDFLPLRFELRGGWQSWQGLREGGAQPPPPRGGSAAYQPTPAGGSGDFKGVSKAHSLFLGTWERTDWVRPQLWLIQLFSTSTSRHPPFWGELSQVSWATAGSLPSDKNLWSQPASGTGWPCPAARLCTPRLDSQPP